MCTAISREEEKLAPYGLYPFYNNNKNSITFFYNAIPQATLGSMRFTMAMQKKNNNKTN